MIPFLFFSTLFYLWLIRLLAVGKNLDDFGVTVVHVVEGWHQRMTSPVMDSRSRCGVTFNAQCNKEALAALFFGFLVQDGVFCLLLSV
ncbi:hypothetical protein C8J56DRAFT_909259, partial [Mycena floridula]